MNVKYVLIPLIVAVTVCVCAVLMDSEESDATANPTGSTRVGDLYYTFNGTNATVIGYSSSIDWSTFTTIPDTVESGGTTYTITSIGSSAFLNCTNLALTSLPDGVTSIEKSTFDGCTSLALTELPSSLTSIGNSAFAGCTQLEYLAIEGSPTIGTNAFQGCTNLKQILNMGTTPIAAGSYGLSEDTIVRTGSEGFDALVMLQDVGVSGQHETIVTEDDSAASTILRAVPIFVILAIITGIILAYMRTTRV